MRPDRQALQSNAQWHLHDFDAPRGTARMLRLTEADYFAASFLDQRVEPLASAGCEISLVELADALLQNATGLPSQAFHPQQSPHPGIDPGSTFAASANGGVWGSADWAIPAARYIFHLGHCGSTLLSRALSASPKALPLREPLTLRRLAAEPGQSHLLPLVVAAHARVFHSGQGAVIKATSTCNALIEPILAANGSSVAILMMVNLETYLAGMLGKLSPPMDLRTQAGLRLADWSRIHDAPPLDPNTMNETQLAVLSWLTSMRHLEQATKNHPGQTLLLDFEALLAQPETALARCATFLGFESGLPAMLRDWPTIAAVYSKKPEEPYSSFNRQKTLQRGRVTRGEEIQQGLAWARQLTTGIEALSGCRNYL